MAYLIQQSLSPYWTAQWTGADGKRKKRSTKVRIKPDFKKDGFRESAGQAKARAQQIADTFEQADQGNATAQKLHSTINALLPSGGVPTIRKYVMDYIENRERTAPKSKNNDRRALIGLLNFLGSKADLTLDKLTTADVNAWIERENMRVRPSTVKLYRQVARVPFRRAFEEELIARDPFALSRVPKTVDNAPIVRKTFSLQVLRKLISKLNPDWAMAVRLCVLLGGLRLGDVCCLKWSQFDFDKGICELVTRKRGVPMSIPLLPSLVKHLKNWPRTSAHVLPAFYARYNSPSKSSLSTEFTSMVRGFGLGKMTGQGSRSGSKGMTDLTFHMLRSTAATILQEAGVAEGIAMKILSHNSRTVHQAYIRPSEATIRAGMNLLDVEL